MLSSCCNFCFSSVIVIVVVVIVVVFVIFVGGVGVFNDDAVDIVVFSSNGIVLINRKGLLALYYIV